MAKKYIDAHRLREEIDRIEEEARKVRVSGTDKEAIGADGKVKLCLKLKSIIASLQQEQPKADLEVRKQIEELANDWHHKGFASDEDCPLCMQDLIDTLWHFYELGCIHAAVLYDDIEYERQRRSEDEPKGLDEAGQGDYLEAEIEEPEPLYWRILLELPGTFMVNHNLKPGDKVVAQVRKAE